MDIRSVLSWQRTYVLLRWLVVIICMLSFLLETAAHASPGIHSVDLSTDRYNFEFQDDPLDVVLYVISREAEVDILYEPHHTEGIMINNVFREEPLARILEDILAPQGLEARRIRTGMYLIRYTIRQKLPPITELKTNDHPDIDHDVFLAGLVVTDAVTGVVLNNGIRLIRMASDAGVTPGREWIVISRNGYHATRVIAEKRDREDPLLLPAERKISLWPIVPLRERVIYWIK